MKLTLSTGALLTLSALALTGCQATNNKTLLAGDQTNNNQQASAQVETTPSATSATPAPVALQAVPELALGTQINAQQTAQTPAQEQARITDLWQRIRQQLQFSAPDNPQIRAQRNWYVGHPTYLKRVSKRAEPFLHLIVEAIEQRDMPMDLVLLPIVESAFDPFAYSHGSASGVWQFIPGTARYYGLDINWWYDGRRDVYAATHAALDYLEYLHDYFDGDWLHALAAYNSGQGRVGAAIRKNKRAGKPTDFWSLDLPRETRAYVPKLLALSDILTNSERYGIIWHPIENQPQLKVVELPAQIDLAKAAEMAGLSLETLHLYNSAYNRWSTAPNGPHRLLLPQANAEIFQTAIDNSDPKQWLSWQRHQIQSGESLITIAKKYHTSVAAIQRVNDIGSHIIRSGDHLLIPVASNELSDYTLSQGQRLQAKQQKQRNGSKVEHIVQSGDTLWDLSRTYQVGMRELAKWNSMAPGDFLRLGQKLVIWSQNEQSAQRQTGLIRTVNYQVRNGDSLARIANKFNVSIGEIEQWNNISRRRYLQPGQRLTLKVDVTNVSG
ncbi:MAG: LysM peptidoglycan-binding domain-containing protein [Pseudomonadota bacterium]